MPIGQIVCAKKEILDIYVPETIDLKIQSLERGQTPNFLNYCGEISLESLSSDIEVGVW